MRNVWSAFFVAFALAYAAPVAAQNQSASPEARPQGGVAMVAAPRSPSPIDGMTLPQQIAYYIEIAENADNAPRDREFAMKRLRFLYLDQRDKVRSDQWLARRNAYILELEPIILAGPPLPAPPPLCTEPPRPGKCGYGAIARNQDAYWRYTTLAEAAEQHRDYARVITLREAAIVFMHGDAPLPSHWLGLAGEARNFGQYDASQRLCAIVSENLMYSSERDKGRKCAAETSFAAGQWDGWLAYYEPTLTGPVPGDPGLAVRYCIATTRADSRDAAKRACSWATESLAARDVMENENAKRRDADAEQRAARASSDAARQRILADAQIVIKRWQTDRALFESVVANCVAAQLGPDASRKVECGGAPDGSYWSREPVTEATLRELLDAVRSGAAPKPQGSAGPKPAQ
jgi:hypothetical protein